MNPDKNLCPARMRRFLALFAVLALSLAVAACDSLLEEESFDRITPENFFNNEEEFLSAAAAAYAPVRDIAVGSAFNLTEHTTDEVMVPTRGADWGDEGRWRQLTQHNWSATHTDLNSAWNTSQLGISRSNSVITSLAQSEGLPEAEIQEFEAEMRFLRAFYYYWLMDLFGSVPIVVEEGSDLDFPEQPVSTEDPPEPNTRKELYDFILQELTGCTSDNFDVSCVNSPDGNSVLANLPMRSGSGDHGRARLGAGHAFLARLLLNAEIFSGTPTEAGIEPGVALYEEASAAADQVLNSGMYSLAEYPDNFGESTHDVPEIIFAAPFKADLGAGNTLLRTHSHANLPTGVSTWNGFSTIAEFYESFENVSNNELRQNQIMEGPRYREPNTDCWANECFSDPTSEPVTVTGSDDQLVYRLDIPSLIIEGSAAEQQNAGARPYKYKLGSVHLEQGAFANDQPIFRLAEIYLIKAEAEAARGNVGEAVSNLNIIRDARDADPVAGSPFQIEALQLILQERGFEFLFESQRRQDLIRYEFAHDGNPIGFEQSDDPEANIYAPTYTGPWIFKTDSDGCRALFPIPQNQLDTNPELEQNPGYPGCGSGQP